MKKKIIIIALILVIMSIPIKLTYYDGASYEYQSLLYKYIVWNKPDLNYDSGYKVGKEFHFFPTNYRSMDYFDDIKPAPFLYKKEKSSNDLYIVKSYNYNWCNDYGKCDDVITSMSNNFDDYNVLEINNNDEITYTYSGNISKIEIYDEHLNPTDEKVDFSNNYINYLDIMGKRIVKLTINSKYGTASYFYAINIL